MSDDSECAIQWAYKGTATNKSECSSHKYIVVGHALDAVSSHGGLDVGQELVSVLAHLQCSLCSMKYTLISSVKERGIPYLYSEDHPRLAPETSTVAQPSLN